MMKKPTKTRIYPVCEYYLSSLPDEFNEVLPDFQEDGELKPGDYAPTRLEFEARFVKVGDMDKRRSIYEGWNQHREALIEAGLAKSSRQLLNGSFTSDKPCPGDIDIAVEVPVADSTVSTWIEKLAVWRLLQGEQTKELYCCEAYAIPVLPPSDPEYEVVTVKLIRYWTKWFGHTRNNTPKGRIWAMTGGFYER